MEGMERKKILIVEDDADTRIGLNARLRAAGYDTAFAADAVNATAAARREHPDLILLDLGLPGGDGFTVLERLQRMAGAAVAPVVVLTARGPDGNAERARRLGAVAYFQKPVDDRLLLRTIDLVFHPLDEPLRAAAGGGRLG